jgi:chromosome segregation ATPase
VLKLVACYAGFLHRQIMQVETEKACKDLSLEHHQSLDRLTKQESRFQQELAKQDQLKEKIKQLESKHDEQEEVIQDLEQQLRGKDEELVNQKFANDQLQSTIVNLSTTNEQLSSDYDNGQKETQRLEDRCHDHELNITQLRRDNQAYESEIHQLKAQSLQQVESNRLLTQENHNCNEKLAENEVRITQILERWKQEVEKYQSLQHGFQQLEKKYVSLSSTSKQWQEENQYYEKKVHEMDRFEYEKHRKDQEIQELKCFHDIQINEIKNQYDQRIMALESSHQLAMDSLKQQLDESHSHVEALEIDFASVRLKLSEKDKIIVELKENLAQIKQDCETQLQQQESTQMKDLLGQLIQYFQRSTTIDATTTSNQTTDKEQFDYMHQDPSLLLVMKRLLTSQRDVYDKFIQETAMTTINEMTRYLDKKISPDLDRQLLTDHEAKIKLGKPVLIQFSTWMMSSNIYMSMNRLYLLDERICRITPAMDRLCNGKAFFV